MATADLKTKLKGFPKIIKIEPVDEGIFIDFTTVKLAEKYDIRRANAQFGDYEHIGWAEVPPYTDTTAEKGVTYWYKIVARKSLENKKLSKKASVTKPCVITDIDEPKNLTAQVKGGVVKLKWDKGTADRFALYRKSDIYERQIFIGETDKNTFEDDCAVTGRGYYYTVQSFKGSSCGKFSDDCLAVVLAESEIITLKALTGKKVEISVRLVSGSDGYIFERSEKEKGDFTEIGRTKEITENIFIDKVPSTFKNYFYRVKPYKIIGEKEYAGESSKVKAVKSR